MTILARWSASQRGICSARQSSCPCGLRWLQSVLLVAMGAAHAFADALGSELFLPSLI